MRRRHQSEGRKLVGPSNTTARSAVSWQVWALATALVVFSGLVYRAAANRLKRATLAPIRPPVPLSRFPTELAGWVGKDIAVPGNIQAVAQDDDFLSRLYTNNNTPQWVNLYLAYSARPRILLGHQPDVCYVGAGWILDGAEPVEVISNSSRNIPGLMYRFSTHEPECNELVVFTFYILNGKLVANQKAFSGIGWRSPNVEGNPARYVTQVQISSALENSVLAAVRDLADFIIDFFPDEDGTVNAAESVPPFGQAGAGG